MKKYSFYVLLSLLAFVFSCEKNNDDTDDAQKKIKIGFLHNFSGTADRSRLNSIMLAVDEINAAGGIYGRQLSLLYEDSKNDTNIIKQMATAMIDSGVVAIVGLNSSTQALIMTQRVSIPAGIVYVGYLATTPALTTLSDNNTVWRTIPSDAFQGKAAAKYAIDSMACTNAAILYIDNTYGVGLANSFKTEFQSLSGTVANYISVPAATTDFSSFLPSVLAGNPQLLYLVTESEQAANFSNQIQEFLTANPSYTKPKVLGCDGNYSTDKFLPTANVSFSNGIRGTNPATRTDEANYTTFVANYTTKYGAAPTASYVSQAYDAIYLLAYAMLKSGETVISTDDSKQIALAIAQNMRRVSGGNTDIQGTVIVVNEFQKAAAILPAGDINYNGVSGLVDFDENGDIKSGFYQIWEVVANNNVLSYKTRTFIQYP